MNRTIIMKPLVWLICNPNINLSLRANIAQTRQKETALNKTVDPTKLNDVATNGQSQNVSEMFYKKRTCKYCGKIYNTLRELREHVKNEEKIYFCHHCENPEKITQQELIEHCKSVDIDYKRKNFFRSAMSERKDEEYKASIDKKPTCKHCGTIYNKLGDLKHHLMYEEKVFVCHHCENPAKMTKEELIDHCKSVGINYKKKKFFAKAARDNVRELTVPDVLYCEICSAECENKTQMEQHYEESHKNHYKCEECNEGFKKTLEYIIHMKTHSDDNLYKCALCNYTTPSRTMINQHLKRKHDQFMNYRCKVCGKGFSIRSIFKEHTKYVHSGERPFQCDHCGKRFVHSGYLKNHIYHVHKTRTAEYKCLVCGVSFPSYLVLKYHRMKKHRKQLYICEVCGKTFDTQPLLSVHSKIHSGEKAFACLFCKKKFRRRCLLVEHERIHTGEKPHVCSHCGKGFSQRSSMVIHTRRHTGERPYACQLCNKAYASRNLLTNHQKRCKGNPP